MPRNHVSHIKCHKNLKNSNEHTHRVYHIDFHNSIYTHVKQNRPNFRTKIHQHSRVRNQVASISKTFQDNIGSHPILKLTIFVSRQKTPAGAAFLLLLGSFHDVCYFLVGGCNPIENMLVKLDHFAMDRGENKQHLKPPPRKPIINPTQICLCGGCKKSPKVPRWWWTLVI